MAQLVRDDPRAVAGAKRLRLAVSASSLNGGVETVSLSFDGTTRLGEALNIVARYCSADFTLEQRLVRFVTVAQHMDAAGLAGLISRVILQELRLNLADIVGFQRDSAAVNEWRCS
eukprot:CAMPEP_0181196834 /NCGR_PEP_ID=MMETSP1096-20121128/15689_1 /TAXON_ID=156174 ORGANISM="Chrysochromulina ericina, Strain CCMP281" /NCGR_SAMPLE_ID=MMETSP1096 /ASSEMBLY_ACC=CAM_ASM_000453 /LENGTH=115 /DNA_ID=CAMNT_0023286645 /DNA_START=140 /DNA_END=486 /DNA_ORIENTATION=-